jgi:tripartite ATP-independent transporter DctM subunit
MSPDLVGVLAFLILLVILLARVPIGAALALVGIVGLSILISPEAALIKAGVIAFDTVSRYELGVLPLFMLMAQLCFAAGASGDFFAMAARFVGHRRGGMAMASIAGCAGFGAISGSSLATVATVSAVALPEMRRGGYQPGFAAGALAAGGTLGSLTPPSGALIVYGIIAEQSIGKLFGAAIIPVVTQAFFYIAVIAIMCRWRPELGPAGPRATWRERVESLRHVLDIAALILFVVGGLIIGWFTPTEAASVGCVGALLILAARRRFTAAALTNALFETLKTTGMIYLIVIGALIFSTFVSVTGVTDHLTGLVRTAGASPTLAVIAMAVILLVLGSFLDGLALMLLMTPILLPIVGALGLSPIWFGIFLVRTMEIGFVHPPLGFNVYVIHAGAKDISVGSIFRGIIPFLLSDFVHLALLIAFPAIVLWLPHLQGGLK